MRKLLPIDASFRLASVIIVLSTLVACTDGTKDSSTDGTKDVSSSGKDSLTIRLSVRVLSANPLTYLSSHERWIIQYTHASLYTLGKESMQLEPELAVGLPDMSEDKLRWTIRLRQDARWHDGQKLTAHDVEASFKVLKDPTVNAAARRTLFTDLTSVKALDDFTCEFVYSQPYYFALLTLQDFPVLPAHVLETLSSPAELNDMKKILGSGPYEITSLATDSVVMERNDKWFGAKPHLKTITYRIIPDAQAAASTLLRGEIDAMGVPLGQWKRDLGNNPDILAGFHQVRYHRPSYKYFGWNCSRPILSDKRTRRALALAFDVDKYLREQFSEGSRRVTGPFFFKGPQHDPQIKPLPYDQSAALKLLEEAGWKDTDSDGTLDRDGEKFEFSVIFLAGYPEVEERSTALKDACRWLGIQVTLRPLSQAAMQQQLKEGKFDCVASGLGTPDPEIDPYQILHSDAIPDAGRNYYRYRSAEADALIEQARCEFDDTKRNELYHRLHRQIYEDQPFLFLIAPEYLLLVNKRFQNVRAYGLGLTPRIGIEWTTAPVGGSKK